MARIHIGKLVVRTQGRPDELRRFAASLPAEIGRALLEQGPLSGGRTSVETVRPPKVGSRSEAASAAATAVVRATRRGP